MKKSPLEEASALFFEGLTPGMLIAGFAMAMIGIFLSLLLSTTKRDPNSVRSPIHFSWNFLWCDNSIRIYKSIALTVIVLFLSLRFSQNLIGQKFSMIYSLILGLCLDKVIERWKMIKDAAGKKIQETPIKEEV